MARARVNATVPLGPIRRYLGTAQTELGAGNQISQAEVAMLNGVDDFDIEVIHETRLAS